MKHSSHYTINTSRMVYLHVHACTYIHVLYSVVILQCTDFLQWINVIKNNKQKSQVNVYVTCIVCIRVYVRIYVYTVYIYICMKTYIFVCTCSCTAFNQLSFPFYALSMYFKVHVYIYICAFCTITFIYIATYIRTYVYR